MSKAEFIKRYVLAKASIPGYLIDVEVIVQAAKKAWKAIHAEY